MSSQEPPILQSRREQGFLRYAPHKRCITTDNFQHSSSMVQISVSTIWFEMSQDIFQM